MSVLTMITLVAQVAAVTPPPASDLQPATARGPSAGAAVFGSRSGRVPFDASRFDSLTANTLRMLFEDAADLGLPVRPLVNRALEGAARRSPSERILRVVREHATALRDARRALGQRATEDELEAGAIAMRAGIDARAVERLRASRPAGAVVIPLVVLTDLVRRGVPLAPALNAVVALARAPRADDLLLDLQATVAKNAQRGPGMALEALNRYVKQVGPPLDPGESPSSDRQPVASPEP